MWATIRKWVLVLVLLAISSYLLYQWFQYRSAQAIMPAGTSVAGIDVSGLTEEEILLQLEEVYYGPLYLYHRNEHVELDPRSVGFTLNSELMLGRLEEQLSAREEWLKFASFVFERPLLQQVDIPLQASHDRAGLLAMLQSIGDFLDKPAQVAQFLSAEQGQRDGEAGYSLELDASIPLVEKALYDPRDRTAQLPVVEQEIPEMNLGLLEDFVQTKLQSFDGTGSIFIMDLETGEEIGINADMAMSGLSILKIAIFVEAYRAIENEPDPTQQQLFLDTATRSSNFGANLLLHLVAGEDNTYLGADKLTESMQRLGLVNTFMAVPFDASPPTYRRTTYITPANSREDLEIIPDETMQSTAEEIGTLLAMVYYCAQGGGPLLAVYPGEITPDECQAIIDLMILNEEGNLIRYGVPEGTPVSHKHGWARATHADAGIVFSPGGDFVIVEYLSQPGDWLLADYSFPILREIARATYNYFNPDEPYFGDPLRDREQIDPANPFAEISEAGQTSEPDEEIEESTETENQDGILEEEISYENEDES
jgi:beta-lactamase class A